VRTRLEPGGELTHVVAAPDQLAGRNRRVTWEEVTACLTLHDLELYTAFV